MDGRSANRYQQGPSGGDDQISIADTIERKMMIAELESSMFERLNPTVIDLMALLNIPAEQVNDLWTWMADI